MPKTAMAALALLACHEIFHWYQGLGREFPLEEPSAYAVMPHCV